MRTDFETRVERRLAAFLAFPDLAVRDLTRGHLEAQRDILDGFLTVSKPRFKTRDHASRP